MIRDYVSMAVGVMLTSAVLGLPQARGQDDAVGLVQREEGSFKGYTLMAPFDTTATFLLDLDGKVVHTWQSRFHPGVAYLLENGHLLRAGTLGPGANRTFRGGGAHGRLQELAWDGTIVWDFEYSSDEHISHHDVAVMPNGHVLMIAWEKKTARQAIAAGRDPEVQGDGDFWPDHVIEVKPTGKTTGRIVWEWHVWDHLIQDTDASKPNFGVVGDHPERININPIGFARTLTEAERKRLESLGYLGRRPRADRANRRGRRDRRNRPGPTNPNPGDQGNRNGRRGNDDRPNRRDRKADFCHTNGIAYNAELDQIALSVHAFSEIWIIDHSTTTEEARGSTGGKRGKGGDLLYRWGNPRAYWQGSADDRQLFHQHDVNWIPRGRPGAGHLIVFNNGPGRSDGEYSSIVELVPPVNSQGHYIKADGAAFGPAAPVWTYTAETKTDFYSHFVSGAQRLPNGNTLICSGANGTLFEVTPAGKTVWKYVNPISPPEPGQGGPRGPGGGGRRNAIFKVRRYAPDFAGLAGRELTPGPTVAEWVADHPDSVRQPDGPGPRGPGGGFRPPFMPLMFALDADRDGELSASEIENAPVALRALDRDGNGKLTREELRPRFDGPGDGPPRRGRRGRPGNRP